MSGLNLDRAFLNAPCRFLPLIAALLLGSGTVHSDEGAEGCELQPENGPCTSVDIGADPGSVGGSILPSDTASNPINLMTGNKSQKESDFAIPGVMLSFNRQYNSENAGNNLGLGQGWHNSYAVSLYDGGNGVREIVQSNGSRLIFTGDGVDDQGRPLMRGALPHHGFVIRTKAYHEWHLPDGRTLTFQGSYLVRIDWPDQRRLDLYYRGGFLHSVTDETGRALLFKYHTGSSQLSGFDEQRFGAQPAHLSSLTLPDGAQISYDYDNNRNLTRVRYPDGSSREYHYESTVYPNHLTGITDKRGVRFATWSYDDEGRAVSSEHAGGIERVEFTFPEVAAVTKGEVVTTEIRNSLGYTSVFTWQQPDASAPPILLSSEGDGCTTCPQTGMRYSYDENGRLLTSAKTSLGNAVGQDTRTYRYDEQGRIAEIRRIDVGGNDDLIERREYAEEFTLMPARIIRPSVKPDGDRVVEIERDDVGLPLRVTEKGWSPLDADLSGSDTGNFEPIERVVTLEYEQGRLVAIDGPRKDVDDTTRFVWDEKQQLERIERPDSPHVQMLDVDSLGRVTRFRLGAQSPVTIDYAGSDHTVAAITHRGRTIRFSYDAEARLTGFTSPDGQTRRMVYNDAGLISELIDDNGQRTSIIYDSEGRRIDTQEFGLDGVMIRSVSQLFDSVGRLTFTDTLALNATGASKHQQLYREYDETNQLASVTDMGSGDEVSVEHNAFGKLANITEPAVLALDTDGSEVETLRTGFEYDAAGNEVALIDGRSNRTLYLKDDFGRVVTLNSPDTGITRYSYDDADNRIQKLNAEGDITTYSWDAANRMIGKVRTDGEFSYAYSSVNGKLTSSVAPDTTELFDYDAESRLVRHERQIDDRVFVTGYQYDEDGRISHKNLPDGQILRYHYRDDEDTVDRGTLKAITRDSLFGLQQETLVGEIDQDGRDGSSGHVSSNGLSTQFLYGADGSITSLSIDQSMKLEYEFDDAGRIVGIDVNGTLQQYRYSSGGLSFADMGDASYRFEYDNVGNRIASSVEQADGSVETTSYRYLPPGSGNRLMETVTLNRNSISDTPSESVDSQKFNDHGAPVARDGLNFEYDQEQRPIRVLENGAVLAEYAYNGFGERIRKVTYSADVKKVTYYLYDGSKLTAEVTDDSDQMRQAVFLDRAPVAYLIGRDAYAVHADHLGTPRMATDRNGNTVWSVDYAPFGKATVVDNTIDIPYRFAGQYFDAETDTHYNYYRDYDPATGRYITSDPIGLQGGLNTYAYALNNPLSMTDPLGLETGADLGATGESPDKPDADSEQAYADKLEKVFQYSYEKLKNTDGQEVLANFMQSLIANIAVVAGIVVGMAAATAAGVGVIANGILAAAGWILAGVEAGKFLISTVKLALELRNTDLCDEETLKAQGDKLADSVVTLGTEIASSALLGGLSKIGTAIKSASDYAGDGVFTLYRKLRQALRADTPATRLCSFAGDTLVTTQGGLRQIKNIIAGKDRVWARDELTGRTGWRDVLAQYSNRYKESVHVTAVDKNGKSQTITSNRIHPYFARLAAGALIATASVTSNPAMATEGHVYAGDIYGGAWVDAQFLQPGDELLSDTGQWQRVEKVVVEEQPLQAYNLTVDEFSTYFVAGDAGADSVWVHNQCFDTLPRRYKPTGETTDYGQPIYRDGENLLYRGHDGRFYDPNAEGMAPTPKPADDLDAPTRTKAELLVDGKVPTNHSGNFSHWWNQLSEAELDVLWKDSDIRKTMERRIRHPGGLHEWCMVCRTPDFKKWGVSMDEIKRFRTKVPELKWTNPDTGELGGHGGKGSTTFHNELKAIIDGSTSVDDFNVKVEDLRERWSIAEGLLPGLLKSSR